MTINYCSFFYVLFPMHVHGSVINRMAAKATDVEIKVVDTEEGGPRYVRNVLLLYVHDEILDRISHLHIHVQCT